MFEYDTEEDNTSGLNYSYGDIVKLKLDGSNETEWIVLKKDEGSKKLTLISKNVMLNDPLYSMSTGKYAYNSLNSLTSTWTQLPEIKNYNYKASDDYSINISNGISTINFKDGVTANETNTKARLLTFEELYDAYQNNLRVIDLYQEVRETFPEVQNVIQTMYSLYKFTDLIEQTLNTTFTDGTDMKWFANFNDEDRIIDVGGQFMSFIEYLVQNGALQDSVAIGQNNGNIYFVFLDPNNFRMGITKTDSEGQNPDTVYVNMSITQSELTMIYNKLSTQNSNEALDDMVNSTTYGEIKNNPLRDQILNGLTSYLDINSVGQYMSLGASIIGMQGLEEEDLIENNFGISISNLDPTVKNTELYGNFMFLMEDMVKLSALQQFLDNYGIKSLGVVYEYMFKNILTRTQSIFYFVEPNATMDVISFSESLSIYDSVPINPVITVSYAKFDELCSKQDELENTDPNMRLSNIILNYNSYETDEGIDFYNANYYYADKEITGDNGNGFFQDSQDSSIYYFRGSVQNNNLNFAGQSWKIVGINSDGSIRIILASPSTTTYFGNTSDYLNSNAKQRLESWYDSNIKGLYDKYVSDPGFCLDSYNGTPTHDCSTENLYSVKNGNLNYPVGLLTTSEAVYAGGAIDQLNGNYYLYASGTPWWLITPNGNSGVYAGYSGLNIKGTNEEEFAIRPVINISAYVEYESGDGSASDPYTIKVSG